MEHRVKQPAESVIGTKNQKQVKADHHGRQHKRHIDERANRVADSRCGKVEPENKGYGAKKQKNCRQHGKFKGQP
jgi:hypothetical protein